MNEDFNIMFEKLKKKDLLTWIKDYEKTFMDNNMINSDKKEILEQVYKGSANIRKYFYNNYLTDISAQLNTKSDKDSYKYLNFFKQVPPKSNRNYYEYYKKEKIEYYDDDNNNNNNYPNKKIIKEEYKRKYNNLKEEDYEEKNKKKNKKYKQNIEEEF